MRHSKLKYQLNRFTSWRRATVLSMARSLLIHQSITTTKAKALALRPLAEKLITLAKENTLSAKRKAFSLLNDHRLVKVLFDDIGPRFKNFSGGYVRILNLGSRRGDNAEIAIIELTKILKKQPKATKKAKSAKEEPPVKDASEATTISEETKAKTEVAVKEKPPMTQKPNKKFLGGIRNIFKKERDSL